MLLSVELFVRCLRYVLHMEEYLGFDKADYVSQPHSGPPRIGAEGGEQSRDAKKMRGPKWQVRDSIF